MTTMTKSRAAAARVQDKGVRAYMAVAALYGKKLTPKQAAERMSKGRAELNAERAQNDAKREAQRKADADKAAKEAILEGIKRMAVLRDLLQSIADGKSATGTPEDDAMLIHAAFVEAGGAIEQGLFDLGIVEGMNGVAGRREGWLKEFLS